MVSWANLIVAMRALTHTHTHIHNGIAPHRSHEAISCELPLTPGGSVAVIVIVWGVGGWVGGGRPGCTRSPQMCVCVVHRCLRLPPTMQKGRGSMCVRVQCSVVCVVCTQLHIHSNVCVGGGLVHSDVKAPASIAEPETHEQSDDHTCADEAQDNSLAMLGGG